MKREHLLIGLVVIILLVVVAVATLYLTPKGNGGPSTNVTNVTTNQTSGGSTCSDSDYGKDIFTQGTITYGALKKKDTCVNSTAVVEYTCAKDKSISVISCPAGYTCTQGACKFTTTNTSANVTPATCQDTDAKSYFVKGAVFSAGKNYVDYCSGFDKVNEYYCDGTKVSTVDYTCPTNYVCDDGKCVEQFTSCTESDGGKDPNTQGTTDGKFAGKTVISETDFCASSDQVLEFYCDGNNVLDVVIDCKPGESCAAGRCVKGSAPPPPKTCTETDGGFDLNQVGTTSNSTVSKTDVCLSNISLREYECLSGSIGSSDVNCAVGQSCMNGECVNTTLPATCIDSDGGLNENLTGTVTASTGTFTDNCSSSQVVEENYCDSKGTPQLSYVVCNAGYACSSGSCVKIPPKTCTDTDTGQDAMKKGTVTDNVGSYTDICKNSTILQEYWCNAQNQSAALDIQCPTNYTCSSGECIYTSTLIPACADTDSGKDYYTSGNVTELGTTVYTDTCPSTTSPIVTEYYCDSSNVKSVNFTCPTGYTCSSGKCITTTCTSTDGYDKYTAGSTNDGTSTYFDTCYNAIQLQEFFCSGQGNYATSFYENCPANYTCSGGACIALAIPVFCTDTDGLDENTSGSVTDLSGTYNDTCFPTGLGVTEMYCQGGSTGVASGLQVSCASGMSCLNGACVQQLLPTCTDSDGGKDVYTGGTVNTTTTIYYDICNQTSLSHVIEYSCNSGNAKMDNIKCPTGYICTPSDNKCTAMTCTDSDGGQSYSSSGTTSNSYQGIYADSCHSSSELEEFYCDGGVVKSVNVTCGIGTNCFFGACN